MSLPAFLAFPGQGSQHHSMLSSGGISDIALSSEYSNALECCSELISYDAFKLIEEGPEELINKTSITQPLLVLCSYLHFNKLVNSININPTYLAGHSLGATSVHEAIYCLIMMKNNFIAASANIADMDDEAKKYPIVTKVEKNVTLNSVMSNSFGFGGTNATLVFEKV